VLLALNREENLYLEKELLLRVKNVIWAEEQVIYPLTFPRPQTKEMFNRTVDFIVVPFDEGE
jgi:hypothetical protein